MNCSREQGAKLQPLPPSSTFVWCRPRHPVEHEALRKSCHQQVEQRMQDLLHCLRPSTFFETFVFASKLAICYQARFTEVITVLVGTHTLCQQSGSQDLSGDQDRLT